jgi:hypothetical protein
LNPNKSLQPLASGDGSLLAGGPSGNGETRSKNVFTEVRLKDVVTIVVPLASRIPLLIN